MNCLQRILFIMFLAAGLNGLMACEASEGPAEEAGEKIDEAAEETRQGLEEAAEEAGEKLEEAGDELREETQ